MRVTGYSYPWDVLEAPGFTERAGELGVDEVAVAVAYHSARAATPWSRERSSVLAANAALYRPVRPEVWADARLRPVSPGWVASRDSAGDAFRLLRAAGFRTAAWVVLTHNSALGNKFPDVAVRNCFGEVYPWALCPARREVRQYAATLAAECLADTEVDSVVLEACGQMGALHQHQHEKTAGVWSPATARLLSVCCCDACAQAWSDAGADPDEVRAALSGEVRRLIADGELDATADRLSGAVRHLLLTTRQRFTDELRRAVLDALGSGPRIVLHGSIDPWATGALPGVTPAAPGESDAVVLQCWQPGQATVDGVARARREISSTVDVGAFVTAVGPSPGPDMGGYVHSLRDAGAAELHLYHLGMAGPGRMPDMRAAVTAARSP